MSDLRKFHRAVVEAFAPLLRKRFQGERVTREEAKERLEYQLTNRGFEDSLDVSKQEALDDE